MSSTIFIIEDDINVIKILNIILEKEGYEVCSYTSGIDALKDMKYKKPDLILLDLILPDIDGMSICTNLKNNHETSEIPILITSSKAQEQEIIDGLNHGCNDYITKPFSEKVLLAKIKSYLKQNKQISQESNKTIIFENLLVNPNSYEVYIDDNLIEFTPAEFKLLYCLISKMDVIHKREQIIEYIDPEYEKLMNLRSIDTLITRIRKKLGTNGKHIETVYGVGYKFKKEIK